MLTFPVGSGNFHFRTAGVWIDDGYVLLHGNAQEDFWALPGGRVEHMESAEGALHRELREELAIGEGTHIERLLWITQYFHYARDWGWSGDQHELGLYFLITPPPDDAARLADKTRVYPCVELDSTLRFRWFPVAELPHTRVMRPAFLNSALLDLPTTPQIITFDARA
jgi:ADP-ribose pyrophosphatase YjhB (NUDIX family)